MSSYKKKSLKHLKNKIVSKLAKKLFLKLIFVSKYHYKRGL